MNRRRVESSTADPHARLDEARALTEAGRHREAVGILEELLAADPSDDQARWAAAACWFQLEDYERAKQRFGELVERHPDFQEAADYLAASRQMLEASRRPGDASGAPLLRDVQAGHWQPQQVPSASADATYGWSPTEANSSSVDTMAAFGHAPLGSAARRFVAIVSAVLAVLFAAGFAYFAFVEDPADERRQEEQMQQEMQQTQEEINREAQEQKRQFDQETRASCERTLGKEHCAQILGP